MLRRMLLASPDKVHKWKESQCAWISLLFTRVQMGQTTAELASDLVAYSYAIFSGYHPKSRAILLSHFPDPVCARLAMCLMDETFGMELANSKVVKGETKTWWTTKFREVIYNGIVSPEKGNFGEVVVALYMLSCGDLLRRRINSKMNLKGMDLYSQFSVSLDAWLQLLMYGGDETKVTDDDDCDVSVGFIQLCRNSLRSYSESWTCLADQSFLGHIFESGIAFYVFPGCETIDMVVSLRDTKDGKKEYVPMLISIKCREKFTNADMDRECKKMEEKAKTDKLPKALCLLISFASDVKRDRANPKDYELKPGEKIARLVSKGVVARAVRVPKDVFGLTGAFQEITPAAELESELYSAHPFLMAHGPSDSGDLEDTQALRKYSSSEYRQDYNLLRKAMIDKKDLGAQSIPPPA